MFSTIAAAGRLIGPMLQVREEVTHGLAAARSVLAADGSPLLALEAFAHETGTPLDDAALAELRVGLRRLLVLLDRGTTAAASLAEALGDPRLHQALEGTIGALVDGAFKAGQCRHQIRRWLADPT